MFIGHIGIIASAAAESESLIAYPFWDIPNSTGTTLSNVNVVYNPPSNTVQIDWGDGSEPESISSGVNYNHTFI